MKSDAEKLTRDEELIRYRQMQPKKSDAKVAEELFLELADVRQLKVKVDALARAVKLIMQRPVQHAISAEEAETLKEVIASL